MTAKEIVDKIKSENPDISDAKLARRVGLTPQNFSDYKRGRVKYPSADKIPALAHALGMDIGELALSIARDKENWEVNVEGKPPEGDYEDSEINRVMAKNMALTAEREKGKDLARVFDPKGENPGTFLPATPYDKLRHGADISAANEVILILCDMIQAVVADPSLADEALPVLKLLRKGG